MTPSLLTVSEVAARPDEPLTPLERAIVVAIQGIVRRRREARLRDEEKRAA